MERFDSCNLDPTSPSYIARKIGDKYASWDTNEKRLREYGEYPNLSKFVYVEVNADVEAAATDPTYLPFGYFGPPVFDSIHSCSQTLATDSSTRYSNTFILGSASFYASGLQEEG